MENTTEFWKQHVAAIRQEGVAVTVYAKRHCLSLASLYYWRQKLQEVDGGATPSAHGKFVDVRIAEAAPPSGACTLILPSGLRLEMPALPAPTWLAA
ncbi:MAG: transposase, partial [Pseudomonadota bacterium]|nr:transposase [Pseudomonadota bacterium]